jgi:hypothetical protein
MLREHRVSYERATARYVALDLEPGAMLDDVRDVLDSWIEQGIAEYETCVARVTGSFDDAPDESEDL